MNKDEKKKLIGFAISNGVTLLAGFISGMGTNIASRHQDNLSIEYQNIKNQNDVLLSEISSLQKELEILTAENETLKSQSNNAKSFIDQPNPDKPEKFFAFPPRFRYNEEKHWRMCSCYSRINTLTRFMVQSPVMTA